MFKYNKIALGYERSGKEIEVPGKKLCTVFGY